jgi:hypothetical protein
VKPNVFIGSSAAAVPVAEHVQAELAPVSLPEIWTNGKFRSHLTPIESLFLALEEFQFAVFIALPEDISKKRGKDQSTMRDNVLFEAGLFLGRLGRERVFMISPQNDSTVTLSLPSDLTGIEPTHYDPSTGNLQAAVGVALHQMKGALRSFDTDRHNLIFDSSSNLQPDQLVFKRGKQWDASGTTPITDFAQGDARVTNEAVEIQRANSEGTFEVEIRPKGSNEPTIPRIPGSDRRFELRFEARVENATHKLRGVIVNSHTYKWLDHTGFTISSQDWASNVTILSAPPGVDVLVRIDDEIDALPTGKVYLRNISIKQIMAKA